MSRQPSGNIVEKSPSSWFEDQVASKLLLIFWDSLDAFILVFVFYMGSHKKQPAIDKTL